MRQMLGPGALGRPRGIGWRGRWEGGSGWGTHVNPWLIHVNVWQKPLQYCKAISLQLIKINGKKKKRVARRAARATVEIWVSPCHSASSYSPSSSGWCFWCSGAWPPLCRCFISYSFLALEISLMYFCFWLCWVFVAAWASVLWQCAGFSCCEHGL